MATWQQHLDAARRAANDETAIVAVAPDPAVLAQEFDDGYGGAEGPAMLAWSEQRVYFPVVYDGSEWIGSAPRNPQPEGQSHVGGE